MVNRGVLDVTSGAQSIAGLAVSNSGTLNLSIGNTLTSLGSIAFGGGTLNITARVDRKRDDLISYPEYNVQLVERHVFDYRFERLADKLHMDLVYNSNELDLAGRVARGDLSSTASGSWTTPGNWSTNAVPSGQGVTAIMGTVPTTPTTVTLDAAQTLGTLVFNNTAGYTINGGSAGNFSLTLDNTGGTGDASIVVLSGTHSIAAPIVLTGGNTAISLTGGGNLSIGGSISDINGAEALTLSSSDSSGLLSLSGTNTYGGGTFVNSGTLILNGASSLLAGSSLTIGVFSSPGAVFSSPSLSQPTSAAAHGFSAGARARFHVIACGWRPADCRLPAPPVGKPREQHKAYRVVKSARTHSMISAKGIYNRHRDR